MFDTEGQYIAARKIYHDAITSVSKRDAPLTKPERLKIAIRRMKESIVLFQKLGDSKMERTGLGWITMWSAEKKWRQAGEILTIDKIDVREKAVTMLEDAIPYFQEGGENRLAKNALRKMYLWKGVIANHKLEIGEARRNFEKSLELAKDVDAGSVKYTEAHIKQCDAWELVDRSYRREEPIPYEHVVNEFNAVLELLGESDDELSIKYIEGWRNLFRFLVNPKDNLNDFYSFHLKVFGIEKETDEDIMSLWLKNRVSSKASEAAIAVLQDTKLKEKDAVFQMAEGYYKTAVHTKDHYQAIITLFSCSSVIARDVTKIQDLKTSDLKIVLKEMTGLEEKQFKEYYREYRSAHDHGHIDLTNLEEIRKAGKVRADLTTVVEKLLHRYMKGS